MKFFNKLFSKRKKDTRILDLKLSSKSINILQQHGFGLDMIQRYSGTSYNWTNSEFQFIIHYESGYYLGFVKDVNAEPDLVIDLIPFLKFLKNDRTFYNKELKEANLWRSLSPDGWVNLLEENYVLLQNLFQDYHPDIYEKYKKFDFDYESL